MYTKNDLLKAFAAGNKFGFESCLFMYAIGEPIPPEEMNPDFGEWFESLKKTQLKIAIAGMHGAMAGSAIREALLRIKEQNVPIVMTDEKQKDVKNPFAELKKQLTTQIKLADPLPDEINPIHTKHNGIKIAKSSSRASSRKNKTIKKKNKKL